MNAGEFLKERGQQMALFSAGVDWQEYTLERLRAFCAVLKRDGTTLFKVEDFEATLQPWEYPKSRCAWGAFPKIALKAGVIAPTDQCAKSSRASTRARLVRVWSVV